MFYKIDIKEIREKRVTIDTLSGHRYYIPFETEEGFDSIMHDIQKKLTDGGLIQVCDTLDNERVFIPSHELRAIFVKGDKGDV